PGDLVPVFDTILEKAHSLCDAAMGSLALYDGEHFRAVAMRGIPEPSAIRLRQAFRATETPGSQPLLAGERFVHIPDLADVDHPVAPAAVRPRTSVYFISAPPRKGDTFLR